MTLTDSKAAADRAAERILRCRLRLQQLRDRVPVTSSDVANAQAALAAARLRALTASIRVSERRTGLHGPSVPDTVHVDEAPAVLRSALGQEAAVGPDLGVAYLGLGGSCAFFELDAFLHGLVRLPRIEVLLLEQAARELD